MSFRTARETAGLSVQEAAALLGVSRQAVYYWEHDITSPTVRTLKAMMTIYCCSADDLLT